MKLGITFLCMMLLSCMFLGFMDVEQAHSRAFADFDLTESELLWAKKAIFLYRAEYYMDFFILGDDRIPWRTYIYETGEHINFIGLVFLIWQRAHRHEFLYAAWFFIMCGLDFIDFFLTHNDTWLMVTGKPVTFNMVQVVVYGIICLIIARGDGYNGKLESGYN